MPTVFTKIINGEIPSYKVAEDDRFYAFLDISPLAAGHTLVVPKFAPEAEKDYIFDLDDDTLVAMTIFAKGVAARIINATGAARVAIMVLGLEVPHVHIHLVPINSEADIDFRKPRLRPTPDEFVEMQRRIAR